jgi:predicted nucleic acid-binding protein
VGRNPEAVLDAALAGRFDIATSPALLEELPRVLAYPELQAVIGDVDEIVGLVCPDRHRGHPHRDGRDLPRPRRQPIIESAETAHADVTVTDDLDVLTLERVDQISPLTPQDFPRYPATPHLSRLRSAPTAQSNYVRTRP